MQTTYEERLNKFVAIILIAVLTLADIIAIGAHFASLALDMVATNSSNVEFEAYFKDENGEKVSEQEINLNAEKTNMYVEISILREGYFNGKISLQDSNFSIIGVTENKYVQGFEESEVKLNQIRSGENITVEVQVKPKTSKTINPETLSKETKVNLEGKYTSSKGEETISGVTTVTAKLITPKDAKANVEAEILTNKILEIDGENKRVLQVLVKSQIENNVYPVLKSNIAVNFPSGVESIEAITRSTTATNNRITFGEDNLIKDLQKSKLEIKLENNKDENGNISFEQNAKDEFVITCVYPEDKTFKNMKELENALGENEEIKADDKKEAQIQISQEITTYDNKVLNANIEANLENDKDGIVNYELTQEESEFYKGKIYSGEERDYNINVIANVNSTKVERNINFMLEDTKYLQGENKKTSKITYKTISIKKDEITKALGEEGYITVKDENNTVIANITKETLANESILIENNNITIKIPENTYKLKIESSKAVQTGKIDFKITKTITEKEYTRDEIKTLTGIENRVTVNEEIISKNIKLKETTTEANFEINAQSLKAGENKNVQIKATLLASDESQDLYKNPTIKITFPSKTTNVEAPYKTLYANGLEVKSATLREEDGRKVLFVEFEGEQKEYFGKAIDGTVLLVNANITMDKLMTNGEDNITLQYTNQNANNYAVQNQSNPTSGTITKTLTTVQAENFIVTNKIAELDVDTTGKEEDKQVEIKSGKGTTNATVEIGGINNEGETLENVKILGRFPTRNTTNTMDITLTSGIELTTSNENVKIYYSAKEDATEDLTDVNNGWTEDSTLEGKTSYLIVIPSLEDKASFGARYGISISKSSEEEKTASEKFVVKYTKQNYSSVTTVESTRIGFKEKENFKIYIQMRDTEETDTIIAGRSYKTYLRITNNSSRDIENVKVVFYPNEYLQSYKEKNNGFDESNSIIISQIKAGQTEYVYFYVKCLGKIENIEKANIYATVEGDGRLYNSNTITKFVYDMSGNIKTEAYSQKNDKDNKVEVGEKIYYTIKVQNTGGDNMNNFIFKDFISKYLIINHVTVNGKKIEYESETNEDGFTVVIIRKNLASKESMEIIIETTVNEDAIINKENNPSVSSEDLEQISDEIDSKKYVVQNYADAENDYYRFEEEIAKEFYVKELESNSEIESGQNKDRENNEILSNEDKDKESFIEKETLLNDIEKKNEGEKNNSNYKITGTVWIDEEIKGYRQNNSQTIRDVNVCLIDSSTGKRVTDKSGNIISSKTNTNGEYMLEQIPVGRYIVAFEFDSNRYTPTEYQKQGIGEKNNSDAVMKNIVLDDEERQLAATDVLEVTSNLTNIDLGLIETKNFNMDITKTISRIVVINNGKTKDYEFKDTKLAKIELDGKKIEGTNVQIEYKIKVKNTGEIAGYVKKIVDYIPREMNFDEKLNVNWYRENNNLYNKSLENEKIEVGKEKELKLILTKEMTQYNTGIISNIAEITETYSDFRFLNNETTKENQIKREEKLGQADIIIGIKTGKTIYGVISILTFLVIAGWYMKLKSQVSK